MAKTTRALEALVLRLQTDNEAHLKSLDFIFAYIGKLTEQKNHLENQNKRLTERVDTLQKQLIQKDLGVHSRRCLKILIPLHLRVLLDMTREVVLSTLGYKKWDDFVQGRDLEVVIDEVDRGLVNSRNKPSRGAIDYLCKLNEVRKRGNVAAHTATKQDIAQAYEQSDKGFLAELYRFRFDEDIQHGLSK